MPGLLLPPLLLPLLPILLPLLLPLLPLLLSPLLLHLFIAPRREARVELARATGGGPPKKGQGKRAKK
jgi:hypothetical protein